jgi:hypothetical protein
LPIAGRVVDRKGQPVAGAKVYLYFDFGEPVTHPPIPPPVRATTGADGRFRFTAKVGLSLSSPWAFHDIYPGPRLAAFAEGYGPAWTEGLTIDDPDGNRLKLVADDAPIAGRLMDLEGRPLPDVTVRVVQIDVTPTEDLSPWLSEAQKDPKTGFRAYYRMFTSWSPDSLLKLIPPAKTGPDGRFQLRGVGRERVVSLVIQGAKVQTRVVQVMTRVGSSQSMRPPVPEGQVETDILIYANGFEHIAAPSRDVEGDVVDAATGQPVPGVIIRPKMIQYAAFENPYGLIRWRPDRAIRTATDARGHYRLDGLPVGHPVELGTMLSDRTPYRPMSQELPDAPSIGPTRLDFKLVRGIPVEGKVTNRTTGKPVAAFVEYLPTLENPNLSSIQDVSLFEPIATRPDGSFTLPALPGPGVVIATAMDDLFLTADRARAGQPAQTRKLGIIRGDTSPGRSQALAPIAPESTAKTYRCDLSVVPAPEPIVRILDPDGRPLAGAIVSGAESSDLSRECWWQSRQHGVFRVAGLIHHRIRNLAIHHEGRRLAGTLAVRDAEPGPLVARLRPWGTVSGRLVDRDGRPRPGVVLSYQDSFRGRKPFDLAFPKDVTTDSSGRFTFVGLVPEQEYAIRLVPEDVYAPTVSVGWPHAVEPGETKELGDVREVTR